MKKHLQVIYFVILCLIFQTNKAQNDSIQGSAKKQTRYELNYNSSKFAGFLAVPLGAFGSTDTETGGFAKNGFGFAFDSKNYISHGFSFISHSAYSWINLDVESMSQQLTDELGLKTVLKDGQHQPFVTTIGVNYDYFFSERFNIGINAQAGILYNSFRALDMKVYDSSNTVIYSDLLSFDSKLAFAYCFGADLTFALIPKVLAFQLSVDYTAGNLDTYLVSRNFDPVKGMEKMQFLNLGAGLIFYKKK